MPLLVLLLQLFILAVVLAVAAFVMFVLATAAIVLVAAGFVLHKTGWDRRLIAHLMKKGGVRVSPPVKVRFDDLEEPIEARWAFEEPLQGDPRRPY